MFVCEGGVLHIAGECYDRFAPSIQQALDDLLNLCQKRRARYRGCIQQGAGFLFSGFGPNQLVGGCVPSVVGAATSIHSPTVGRVRTLAA